MAEWGFYGRRVELDTLAAIFARQRWFFVRLSGRRRIGKTTLLQHVMQNRNSRVFYVQIPDSGPAGVLSTVHDAYETFAIDKARFPAPTTLMELANTISALARDGYVIALDEFQYFHRKHLYEFTSNLQHVVDELSRAASNVRRLPAAAGGLRI